MTRICAKCKRGWSPLAGEAEHALCPTCRQGMKPLSTQCGERKGEKRLAPVPELGERA